MATDEIKEQEETQHEEMKFYEEEEKEQEQEVAAPQEEQVEEKKKDEDRNFVALREKAERAERERDELLRLWKAEQEERQRYRQPEPNPQPKEEEISLSDDDIPDWGTVKKVINKYKEELNSYKQQAQSTTIETKLRTQYPDFDKVVNRQNVEMLRESYPEIANALHTSGDQYSVAASAYTIIKKLGIYQDEGQYKTEKNLVAQNQKKPRSAASVNPAYESPLKKAGAFQNPLTEEEKKRHYREMMEAINK